MSLIDKKSRKKKGKYARRGRKPYHLRHKKNKKTRKIMKSKWKLEYPKLFERINEFPYIVRKNE